MKIVHVCFMGSVTDGFTYQDNILPKYHKRLGNDVSMITSKWVYDKNGRIVETSAIDYVNDDGVHIIRLDTEKKNKFADKFKRFKNFYSTLEKESPDILFVHGVQFLDISVIVKYVKKHKNVKVYVDNHCDYSNSATNFLSKYILHRIIWRHMAKRIEPYTTKFYGVLPARVDFLIENYHLPKEKCELLIMGVDDEVVEMVQKESSREEIREKLNVKPEDFLIVTGGKIDANKSQTLLLMKAVKKVADLNVKLVVFGSVDSNIEEEFNALCDGKTIQYIGWADRYQSTSYFYAADLVVFAGLHSVYWEQVVALGIPMLCKDIKGVHHIDIGGNARFLKEDSVEEIERNLDLILKDDKAIYLEMLSVANNDGKNQFLYSKIAERSIEDKYNGKESGGKDEKKNK